MPTVLLSLQVWSRAVAQSEAAALPPLYTGVSAAPCASDVLLGCAALDLSALQLLGTLDGWYNITDLQQQPVGQLKVGRCTRQQHCTAQHNIPQHTVYMLPLQPGMECCCCRHHMEYSVECLQQQHTPCICAGSAPLLNCCCFCQPSM